MDSSLVSIFDTFFNNNNMSIYIDKVQSNEEKLRIKDKKSNIYINIYWEDIVSEVFYDTHEDFHEYIDHNVNVADLLLRMASDNVYVCSNKKLKRWFFYQEPENRVISGLFEIKQGYAEFEIEANNNIYYENLMIHFYMKDIEVKISSPSDIYRLIFFHHISEKIKRLPPNYLGWNEELWANRMTISFRKIGENVKEASMNNILQEAMFLLKLYNKEMFNLGITMYHKEKFIYDSQQCETKHFPNSNFREPFCFYNEACRYSNEMKFLNFYKVLEFFYDINKKELAIEVFNQYNNSFESVEIRNEKLHAALLKIYTNDGGAQLKNLLKNKIYINYVSDLATYRFNKPVSIEYFCEQLYKVRNAVVHSQESSREIPKIICDYDMLTENKYGLKIPEWIEIIEELCLIGIQHFCYNDELNIIEKYHEVLTGASCSS